MLKLHTDFETHSDLDLNEVGAFKYAMHKSTDILCMAYSSDDSPVTVVPRRELVAKGAVLGPLLLKNIKELRVEAHSAHFEYAVWYFILSRKYGWPALPNPQNWDCTLARAAMCGSPISLAGAGAFMGVSVKKDLEGRAIMLKLAKPYGRDPKTDEPLFYDEDSQPEMFQRLYSYCGIDVEVEKQLDRRLPELLPQERKIWELDLRINSRGVTADVAAARRAQAMAGVLTESLNTRLRRITNGAVDRATMLEALKRFLFVNGVYETRKGTHGLPDIKVPVKSLDKAAIAALMLRDDVHPVLKEAIKIRQQVGKSSTAKYQTMITTACDHDNRMRGLLQYHAAQTGRWGGRLVQPQNFPKGIGFDSEAVIEDVLNLSPNTFDLKYGDKAMDALSAGLRAAMTAGEGNILVGADYSAIEARVLLWLAGDHFALAKYKMGVNLYVDLAKVIYNNDAIDKKTHPKEYAVGKEGVLGSGYGMGWVKFLATCRAKGIVLDTQEPSTIWAGDELKRFFTKEEAKAQLVISVYRKKYKRVVELWYATEAAARAAIRTPGTYHFPKDDNGIDLTKGKLLFGMDPRREFLIMRLPSGRHIRYYRPSLKVTETPYGEKEEIHYWAAFDPSDKKFAVQVDPSGFFAQYKTYGGSLVENAVQGIARDIMGNGMLNAEKIQMPVVLTVHDELITEIARKTERFAKYSRPIAQEMRSSQVAAYAPLTITELTPTEALIGAMCDLPPWAEGCPIAAEGWSGRRYRK